MIVVVAHRHGKHPFGLLLLNHKTIQIIAHLLGLTVKGADGIEGVILRFSFCFDFPPSSLGSSEDASSSVGS